MRNLADTFGDRVPLTEVSLYHEIFLDNTFMFPDRDSVSATDSGRGDSWLLNSIDLERQETESYPC